MLPYAVINKLKNKNNNKKWNASTACLVRLECVLEGGGGSGLARARGAPIPELARSPAAGYFIIIIINTNNNSYLELFRPSEFLKCVLMYIFWELPR